MHRRFMRSQRRRERERVTAIVTYIITHTNRMQYTKATIHSYSALLPLLLPFVFCVAHRITGTHTLDNTFAMQQEDDVSMYGIALYGAVGMLYLKLHYPSARP
mmetsp:Transcript_14945/g.41407  ORF Transcript_14945/g.41407 Transcript_14945/m.41407 type:complete len:103 (-) Transcript_14945:239-547(-)